MELVTGLVLILAAAAVATLAWCVKKVSGHDANDRELITRVDGLQAELSEFKSDTKESLAALNNKIDRILEMLAAERQAA